MKIFVINLIWIISMLFYPMMCQGTPQDKQGVSAENIKIGSQMKEILETEKLQQEVLKLQHENKKLKNPWAKLSPEPAFITAIVALMGIFLTYWKHLSETKRQRDLDRRQRELDRDQREKENQREVDQKFTAIVASLGSESETVQASAVVSLMTFLGSEYESLHNQIFSILLANLKIPHSNAVNQLIVEAFEKALRRKFDLIKERNEKFELDLSRANLNNVNLSHLDLTGADIGFAQLRLANLTETTLLRVRGYEANLEKARLSKANLNEARLQKARLNGAYLHGSNLIAADLKETDLRNVQLYKAKMQAAHLDGANIIGARFEQANISDTYFTGVKVDIKTLKSLVKAKNWQKAHFDDNIKLKLEEISQVLG